MRDPHPSSNGRDEAEGQPLDQTPPPSLVASDEPAAPSSKLPLRLAALGGWGLALLFGLQLRQQRATQAPASPPPACPSASAPTPAAAPLPAAASTGRGGCPAGMLSTRERAGLVLIEQPNRPTWPRPRRQALAPVEVAVVCIDPRPVSAQQYADCVARGDCGRLPEQRPNPSCNWAGGASPMNCVTLEEARAYCQRRGADVPSVRLWEAASKKLRALLEFPTNTGDWALDPFPAPIFEREPSDDARPHHMVFAQRLSPEEPGWTAPRALDFGWNRAVADARRPDLTFRCALELPLPGSGAPSLRFSQRLVATGGAAAPAALGLYHGYEIRHRSGALRLARVAWLQRPDQG